MTLVSVGVTASVAVTVAVGALVVLIAGVAVSNGVLADAVGRSSSVMVPVTMRVVVPLSAAAGSGA